MVYFESYSAILGSCWVVGGVDSSGDHTCIDSNFDRSSLDLKFADAHSLLVVGVGSSSFDFVGRMVDTGSFHGFGCCMLDYLEEIPS